MYVYAQLCPTFCDPMNCSPPGSFAHGIFQARMLEWAAISSSKGSSQPRDRTLISCVSCIVGRLFTCWAFRETHSGGSAGRERTSHAGYAREVGLIPGWRRSPGGGNGNGNLLQWSCQENPMDRGAWMATVHGIPKSWTWLSAHTHLEHNRFHFWGNLSSSLCGNVLELKVSTRIKSETTLYISNCRNTTQEIGSTGELRRQNIVMQTRH